MQKWEYVTVPLLVHATKQILDNWGDDGWELVALVPGPNSEQLVAYMKRPREGVTRPRPGSTRWAPPCGGRGPRGRRTCPPCAAGSMCTRPGSCRWPTASC